MGAIPVGVKTVSAEGADVRAAVEAAAAELGVSTREVGYTLDLSHFRTGGGSSVARTTVKVICWVKPAGGTPEPEPAPEPAPVAAKADADEAPKAERPRRERAPRERKEEAPAADPGETEASVAAAVWFTELIKLMGLVGTATAIGTSDRIRLTVKVDNAGRLIGRRGATLAAIRQLLKLALDKFGDFIIDVDIPDEREGRSEGRSERRDDDRGGRDRDRGDRGGRDRDRGGRDRDRGGRDRDRDRGPRGDRDDRGPRSEHPEEKLQALAQRAADKAIESGRSVTIKLLLNSHDRRIIHITAAEIDGVESNSVIGEDGKKYIQIAPVLVEDDS